MKYARAQAWLLPAALGAYEIVADARTSLLRTYVPENLAAAARYFAAQGIAEPDARRLIYSES